MPKPVEKAAFALSKASAVPLPVIVLVVPAIVASYPVRLKMLLRIPARTFNQSVTLASTLAPQEILIELELKELIPVKAVCVAAAAPTDESSVAEVPKDEKVAKTLLPSTAAPSFTEWLQPKPAFNT